MGVVYADIELINAVDLTMDRKNIIGDEEIKRMRLSMLVDSRAFMMALLGAIPMGEMDVLVDPKRRELVVNPRHPYYAVLKM